MGNFLSRANEDAEHAEGPDALDARGEELCSHPLVTADDKTEPIVFEEEKGLTTIKEQGEPDGRTYAEVVREGPEKSDWKFVPTSERSEQLP